MRRKSKRNTGNFSGNKPSRLLFAAACFLCVAAAVFAFRPQATIRVDAGSVINGDFYGFGVETLPWLWSRENREAGVDETDIRLNVERMRDMRLPLARIFVPWETWNPALDYSSFTWDSATMQSLCKTLDVFQSMGTSVIVVTVDWLKESPWKNPEAAARAAADLLEYLVKTKGYTCVKFWTLTNEPELTYEWLKKLPFENYVRAHRTMKEQLLRRALPVKIIVSDEVESQKWFEDCLNSLGGADDVYASHLYCYPRDAHLIPGFLSTRMDLLKGAGKKEIPFFLSEFGFRGRVFGPCDNSAMEGFEYGLYTAKLCTDVLNGGAGAASLWCLHHIRVIDEVTPRECRIMRIGLWAYKDRQWRPFPVFYLYRLFTRYVRAGSQVVRTELSGRKEVYAACVRKGDKYSLFIVNMSSRPLRFKVTGLPGGMRMKKYEYSASDIQAASGGRSVRRYATGSVAASSVIVLTDERM